MILEKHGIILSFIVTMLEFSLKSRQPIKDRNSMPNYRDGEGTGPTTSSKSNNYK